MGTDLVDGRPPGHAEGDHDGAALLLDESLALHAQVLDPGHGAPHDLEALAVAGTLFELGHGLGAHVEAGEHGVDHPDAIHGHEPMRSDRRRAGEMDPCRGFCSVAGVGKTHGDARTGDDRFP